MAVHYIHIDSKNRDMSLYPYGNSYTLHLQTPIKNPIRVELVSAKIPNSMYNLTNGSDIITFDDGTSLSVPNGFYSGQLLATALDPYFQCLQAQGKFKYSGTQNFTLNTEEISRLLGFDQGTSFPPDSVSQRVIDLSMNEYVFLDIEEFRTPYFSDAKSLPISGLNAGNMFAAIPMDIASTNIKTFKEYSDYSISIHVPPQTLSRLTIHWYDKNLNPLNFQGYENNAFILRVHTSGTNVEQEDIPRPEEIDKYIKEVKRRLDEEELPKKEKKRGVGRWAVFVAIIGILFAWYMRKKSSVV